MNGIFWEGNFDGRTWRYEKRRKEGEGFRTEDCREREEAEGKDRAKFSK
jgi:hypothetical protein